MKKLGRIYNEKTMMWEFSDGSGVPIPQEVMSDIDFYARESRQGVWGAGISALGIKWAWEEKYKKFINNVHPKE